jgi:hypothetical protein
MSSRHATHFGLVLAVSIAADLANCGAVKSQTVYLIKQAAVDTVPPHHDLSGPAADPVQGSGMLPIESVPAANRPQTQAGREREPRGNPLWAIPLRSLTATRERPLFTPSRRPAQPTVAGGPLVEGSPPPPPAGPDRPQLTLVGAISGETEGIAIFLEQNTRDIVRLRTGESHPSGWTLRSVKGREAALVKDEETVILALPAPTDDPQQQLNRNVEP